MNICIYCKGLFSSKGALIAHQKKARYCLDIQVQINPETIIDNIPCQYCDKTFTRKGEKNVHEAVCKSNTTFQEHENKILIIKQENENKILIIKQEHENKIKEKDIEIAELKNEILKIKLESEISKKEIYKDLHDNSRNIIDKIASQPKNTSNVSNNTVNIPTLNINQEHLSQAANDGFTKELFLQGQTGVAKFLLEYIKESNGGVIPIVVSDKSREILKYKDKNQEIVTDTKGNKLTQLAFDAVKMLNQKHYDSFYSSIKENNSDTEEYNSDDDNEKYNNEDAKQELADKCFISIKKLPKDNSVFRKKIIEGCN
jgi:hypothetical protein